MILGIQREIARLDAQKTTVVGESTRALQPARRRSGEGERVSAGEIVPALAGLGRRLGLRVQAVKQSAQGSTGEIRQIQIRAQGGFAGLVAFLDEVPQLVAQARVEELTLRHLSESREVELDSVLYVRVETDGRVESDDHGSG